MPSYNYARYLEASVRSVFAQSYRPLELIIVDDGSTDDSAALIERLAKDAPIPVRTLLGQHRGVSAALNLAVKEARGEWLCILAADDISKPERMTRLMSAVEEGVVLVHSEYECIDAEGARTAYDSSTDLPPARGSALRDLLELLVDVRSMTVMIRSSAMVAQPYDEDLPSEDWQSILRLAKVGRIAHIPEALVERRVHTMNASFTSHRKKKTFSMKEIGIDVLREVCPTDIPFDRVGVIHASVVIRNAMAMGAWEKVADGIRQCWDAFPTERALLLRSCSRGFISYAWVNALRPHTPPFILKLLLGLKAQLILARYR